MPEPERYTVGWICAIKTEYVAARAFLDEIHKDPVAVSPNDNNAYTTGRMGEHNVVIAVLPDGEYGISSAASVARDMMHSFSNIRVGLMVGIGGGAPSRKHDIRLGDIVVSAPRDGKGGVFQYDFGKTIQDQSFRPTGFLNQPPAVLRTAMTLLSGQYESDGHNIEMDINDILQEKPRLQNTYGRPDPSSDRLYRSGVVHPVNDDASCVATCGTDGSKLILRPERTRHEDNPAIHYGLIASANQLMKDALIRDKLATEMGVLCFEMEAAGLMNHFPCLVVRGICDYSDSHKKKEWQGYAAMTAAAYAKDLLRRIAPNKIEAEKKLGDILSDLHGAAEQGLDIAQKHHEVAETHLGIVKARLSQKEQEEIQKCHQLFRLTDGSRDTTYEWYKDRVEDRVKDTCLWFLQHERFQSWLKQDFGPLLVTADPGCGKSVLAKYLIDHGLPQSATICYFFFKDQDQNTVRQALCALLHQLFSQKPALIEHAMTQFRKDGQGLINSTESLWKVLRSALKDPQARPVIMVLDALDECAESEFTNLMRNVQSQFRSDQSGHGTVKYLLTSRPYEQIVSEFQDLLGSFPNIRIPGEEESEAISQEVNCVITHRVNQLSEKKHLSDQVKVRLMDRLLKITHRTYLWAYLVFDHLKTKDFKKTPRGVESAITTLPETVNDAYEQILNRSKEPLLARKALSIILAASRPLTLSEMNVAVNIDGESRSMDDLDLEDENDFKCRLRSLCGLFLSIHHGKIYFLHQTAREFLLVNLALPITTSSGLRWHHSITIHQAHTVLAELCVLYLNFFNSDFGLPTNANGEINHSVDSHAFLDYSAKTWGSHFRKARIMDNASIMPYALRISNPDLKSYSAWFRIYWRTTRMEDTDFTDLLVASYFGHSGVVKLLLEQGADIEAKDSKHGRTPLLWAANKGHGPVVKLLLRNGANVEAKDSEYNQTPLSLAALQGHGAVVRLLLGKGADIEAKDSRVGRTPLLWAAEMGHEAVFKLLLRNGANIEAKNRIVSQTPGWQVAWERRQARVQLLLRKCASIKAKNNEYGQTPLSWAALEGHGAIVKLLLGNGADVEAKNKFGQTPLLWAALEGHEAVVKLLLGEGADIEAKDSEYGQTPLLWAALEGHEAIVKLLLGEGADIEVKDSEYGQTPLSWAAEKGHKSVVKILLENGADVEAKDSEYDQTPLLWAALEGHAAVVRLLLGNGADIEAKDSKHGRTPLLWAADEGHEAVVKLLLGNGANVEAKDSEYDRTPLLLAALEGHAAIVKLLLGKGADVKAEDSACGQTPLLWAAEKGHKAVVKLLLEKGANVVAKDSKYGRTPLLWAARNGHVAVVKQLLEKDAYMEAEDSEYG